MRSVYGGYGAFEAMIRVAEAHGIQEIKQFPQGWYYRLDATWEWVVNGTPAPIEVQPEGTLGATVPAYTAAVWFNGWLAGIVTPYGGGFAAGEAANEETFLAAVEAALQATSAGGCGEEGGSR